MTARQGLWSALALVLVAGLWCVIRVSTAHAQLARVVADNAHQRAHLARCVGSGGLASTAGEQPVANDLVAQVQRALTNAGVAVTAFRGIQPLAERTDQAAKITERTVQVHLEGVRPSDLGAWLAAWCIPGQAWDVIECTWSHPPAGANTAESEQGLCSISLRSRSPL